MLILHRLTHAGVQTAHKCDGQGSALHTPAILTEYDGMSATLSERLIDLCARPVDANMRMACSASRVGLAGLVR